MNKILNLTQHTATKEQVEVGVVEPQDKAAVQELLTFDSIPSRDEMVERARKLGNIVVDSGCSKAMIGGAPYFMGVLEAYLYHFGVKSLYAFSKRVSVETVVDGVVTKTNVFKHQGFVVGGVGKEIDDSFKSGYNY